MPHFDDDFTQIIGAFPEFEDSQETVLDEEGQLTVPFIPLRDLVVFPNMVTPLFVGRSRSLAALEAAHEEGTSLICAAQIDPDIERPERDDIYDVGVEVVIGRTLRMPDGTTSALVQGRRRVHIDEIVSSSPYYVVKATPIPEDYDEESSEIEARMRTVLTLF